MPFSTTTHTQTITYNYEKNSSKNTSTDSDHFDNFLQKRTRSDAGNRL